MLFLLGGLSGRTVEAGRGLQAVGAVDVVLHVQLQPGATEKLAQSLLCDGRLLHNDHSVLINELVTTGQSVSSTRRTFKDRQRGKVQKIYFWSTRDKRTSVKDLFVYIAKQRGTRFWEVVSR